MATARSFHQRLVSSGIIPLFSLHHLEEILAIADLDLARARVAFIADLPLIAWLGLPGERGPGSITQIVAAEAIAIKEGGREPMSVRDRARSLLLRTGHGTDMLGNMLSEWELVRDHVLQQQDNRQLTATLRNFQMFDETRTIGEISKRRIRPPQNRTKAINAQCSALATEISNHGDKKINAPAAMAAAFYEGVTDFALPTGITVRQMIVQSLVMQFVVIIFEFEDLDLLALAFGQAVLKIDARQHFRHVAEIPGRSPNQRAKLTKGPMGRLQGRLAAWHDHCQGIGLVRASLDADFPAIHHAGTRVCGATLERGMEVVEAEEALIGGAGKPFRRDAADLLTTAGVNLEGRGFDSNIHALFLSEGVPPLMLPMVKRNQAGMGKGERRIAASFANKKAPPRCRVGLKNGTNPFMSRGMIYA